MRARLKKVHKYVGMYLYVKTSIDGKLLYVYKFMADTHAAAAMVSASLYNK